MVTSYQFWPTYSKHNVTFILILYEVFQYFLTYVYEAFGHYLRQNCFIALHRTDAGAENYLGIYCDFYYSKSVFYLSCTKSDTIYHLSL